MARAWLNREAAEKQYFEEQKERCKEELARIENIMKTQERYRKSSEKLKEEVFKLLSGRTKKVSELDENQK